MSHDCYFYTRCKNNLGNLNKPYMRTHKNTVHIWILHMFTNQQNHLAD